MAQYVNFFLLLVLYIASIKSIFCDLRRDRALYVGTNEHNAQNLDDTERNEFNESSSSHKELSAFKILDPLLGHGVNSHKVNNHEVNNHEVKNHEVNNHEVNNHEVNNHEVNNHEVNKHDANNFEVNHYKENNQDENDYEENDTESAVEETIRNVFAINVEPGLHLFPNTDVLGAQTNSNPLNNEKLVKPSSALSDNNNEFFKIQRNPNGKLSLVYNEDYIENAGKDKKTKDKIAPSGPSAGNAEAIDSTIFFPSDEYDEMPSSPLGLDDCLDKEEVMQNKTFCTNTRNYPDKRLLEGLIQHRFPNSQSFFSEDFILPDNINQRMNSGADEEFLCPSRTRVIYPQSGVNKDWDWIFIVNSPHYKQGIRIEECLEKANVCGQDTGLSLPNRFTATCEQNYIYRTLIAYNNKTVFSDTFRIPSCCKCVLRTYY